MLRFQSGAETLFALMRRKTSLLITHRLVGLENVDEILVLDHGQIAERGTHLFLLNQNGLYHRLWSLQNRILVETSIRFPVIDSLSLKQLRPKVKIKISWLKNFRCCIFSRNT